MTGTDTWRSRAATVACAAIVTTLMAASVWLQIVRDRLSMEHRQTSRYLYLQSDSAVKRLALAYQTLVADIYWIRTIQHYGGDRLAMGGGAKYELLYPLLDITTTLDPKFTIAYRFGAIFLAEPSPGGPGRLDLATKLLAKGLGAQPAKWQYMLDIGFLHYWQLGDSSTAALWFQKAAGIPNAPNWLSPLAASVLVRGGDREASRFLWRQLRESADQTWLRALAEKRLLQLQAMDQIEELEVVTRRFRERAAAGPLTWEQLVRAGQLPGVPLDPSGTPYELNPWWGTVSVARQSALFPLPAEPKAIRPQD